MLNCHLQTEGDKTEGLGPATSKCTISLDFPSVPKDPNAFRTVQNLLTSLAASSEMLGNTSISHSVSNKRI